MAVTRRPMVFAPYTVHGAGIGLNLNRRSVEMITLCLWFGACLSILAWESTNTLTAFTEYSVKTKVESIVVGDEGLPFPAITFCSASMGLRSYVGGNPNITIATMAVLTRTVDLVKLKTLASMCDDPNVSPDFLSKLH